jgi:hypothetical protein
MNDAGAAVSRRAKGRTLGEFRKDGKLLPAEQTLLEACASGDWATAPADPQRREACNKGRTIPGGPPREPDEANRIRAGFLRFLALGGDADAVLHEHALQVAGVWIEGGIDFEGCKVPAWLELVSCTINGELNVRDAEIKGLNLRDTRVIGGIVGDRLRSHGIVFLGEGTCVNRTVTLTCARIDGDLSFDGCHINGEGELVDGRRDVLVAYEAEIKGSVTLRNGFSAKGTVALSGASIAGVLACDGGSFEGPFIKVDGKDIRDWALRLDQANIGGDVSLGLGEYREKPDDKEMKKARFRAVGGVTMATGRIGGSLNCCGACFEGSERNEALLLYGAEIKGNVRLAKAPDQPFIADGMVHFVAARISGDLDCSGGVFNGWVTTEIKEGKKVERRGLALFGDHAGIAGSVLLKDGFHADGGVQFHSATIGGDLDCEIGQFDSNYYRALNLENSDINGWFYFRDVKRVTGHITLTAAHVATLADDTASWEAVQPHRLDLDGFCYDRFAGADDRGKPAAPTDAKSRIGWLDKQPREHLTTSFKPQPWDQLIKVLRDTGHAAAANEVAIRKNWRQVRNNSGPLRWLRGWLYGWLYGFGYRPARVLVAAAVVWAVCAGVYWCGAQSGVMVPTDQKLAAEVGKATCAAGWIACRELAGRYTTFNSLAYSLDHILPIVDLNQKKTWAPQIVWNCAAQPSCPEGVDWAGPNEDRVSYVGFVVAAIALLENLFGWIAGGVLAAVMGGLIKRD